MATTTLADRILRYFKEHPNESYSQSAADKQEFSKRLGNPSVTPQTIGWVVWRLGKAGLLSIKKEGHRRIYFYSKS